MSTKTLTRKDAYDAKNWRPAHNSTDVECLFEEEGQTMRAFVPASKAMEAKKPADLDPMLAEAIKTAQPIQVLYPIEGSFMHMSYQKPPVWESIMANFRINVGTTLFTFGDVIHNPGNAHVPDDFVHHEEIHAEQQGHNPEGAGRWWARYFQDPYFRIDQEARAFAHQYDWWCKNGPKRVRSNREDRFKKLLDLSQRLASPTYGSMVNVEGAKKLIKQHSKTK